MKSPRGKKALKEAFGIDMEKTFPCSTSKITYPEDFVSKKLYSFLHPNARRVQTEITTPSLTQSEFAKELDINYLVEKHVRSGIPFPTQSLADFRDVSSLPDFQAAQQAVITARESWYRLDPKIRRHFGDRPENFLEALHDPSRIDELVKLKIVKKPVTEAPKGAPDGSQGGPEPKAKGGGGAPGTVST